MSAHIPKKIKFVYILPEVSYPGLYQGLSTDRIRNLIKPVKLITSRSKNACKNSYY